MSLFRRKMNFNDRTRGNNLLCLVKYPTGNKMKSCQFQFSGCNL